MMQLKGNHAADSDTETSDLTEEQQLISDSSFEGPFSTLSSKARNRENSKNTRSRKNNFVETVKEEINQLIYLHDARDQGRKSSLSKLADQVLNNI